MAVRDVLKMGDPRLLRRAQPVTDLSKDAVGAILTDMFDTMRALGGVGLAAPQIGVDLRIVIFGFESSSRYPDAPPVPETVLINPVIEPLGDDREEGWEGCLSVPGLRGSVPRYTRIRYSGTLPDGATIERLAEGFHARVVQHECDHLDGQLFPMLVENWRDFGFTDALPRP